MVTKKMHFWEEYGFFGGHTFLDFVNTFDDLGKSRQLDAIPVWGVLLRWAERVNLIDPREMEILMSFKGSDAALEEINTIHYLRELGWRVLNSIASDVQPRLGDVSALGERIRGAFTRSSLVYSDQSFDWVIGSGVINIALVDVRLALLANDLLSVAGRTNISVCGGCTGLFLNRGRGVGRKWCRMSTCGNRSKIMKFRAKK